MVTTRRPTRQRRAVICAGDHCNRQFLLGQPRYAGRYQSIFRKRHQYRPDTSKAVGVSNCEKVIERDVEAYREKSQSFCVHLGARSADVVSYNAQFAAMVAEQHALDGM